MPPLNAYSIQCRNHSTPFIDLYSLMFSLIDKNLYDSFVHFDNGVYV